MPFWLYLGNGSVYNSHMTKEQLKAAIKAKGYTLKAFADVLGISYTALRKALAGTNVLTEQLRRHIILALAVETPAPDGARKQSSLSLPDEIWQAIDTAAAEQGISSEKYTKQLLQDFATQAATSLLFHRVGK